MSDETVRRLPVVAAVLALTHITAMAQVPTTVGPPAAVLVPQPDSPLEILSMRPISIPPAPNVPPRIVQAMADYELVLRNKTNIPIMAYAISHEFQAQAGAGRNRTCQASLGFSEPMIGAGEIKTIQSHLTKHGPSVTPVVDLVLLKDGTYFGADSCKKLNDYTTRLEERRATLSTIMKRVQKEGLDKTIAWIKQELDRDMRPLLAPKKLKASSVQSPR